MRSKRLVTALAVMVVAAAAAFAILFGPGGGSEEESYRVVASRDDIFAPEVIRVDVGTTVEWRNTGRNPHTVTAEDGSFDSGLMEPGEEYERTFDSAGIFPFICTLHGTAGGGGMTGVVAVGDAPYAGNDGTPGAGPGREPVPANPGRTIRVPADQPTVQAGVDAAAPGDLVLISPGEYRENVRVTTPYLTIRGVDRNTTILDGELRRANGIHVIEADGVAIENLTARHYVSNGFYWTGVNGYRGSYLTAYANGDYGVYAFGSVWGRIDHSYASGSPDSGFYIGQCYPCHAVIDDVIAEGSALGYSGTNAGGDLWIINSTWANNGAGIVPNTLDSEDLAPQRGATIAGNLVYSNGLAPVPTKRLQTPAFGAGILIGGGRRNEIRGNVVRDNALYGIAVLPNLDDNLWLTKLNEVRGNDVASSGRADLALGGPAAGGDCYAENTFVTSVPPAIEQFASCLAPGGDGGDLGPTVSLLAKFVAALGGNYDPGDWTTAPAPVDQPQLPGGEAAPVVLAVPETAVPGPHDVRSLADTLAALPSTTPAPKEALVMGIPFGPIGSTLLGLYAYVLPLALYAAWISIALWDLVRRDLSDRRRIGWMALVLALPVIGPIAYFGLGGSQIPSAVRWFLVVGGIAIYLGIAVLTALVQAL